jgi:formamidopyrimidine-DNA glycosylase
MPELIEVELYCQAAVPIVGRRVVSLEAPDAWFCKGVSPQELTSSIVGRTVRGVRRIGKLMILDISGGSRVGLRFGMTGRLIVNDHSPIEQLQYGPSRQNAKWDRFALRFGAERVMRINDPRRLGGVELNPDETRFGPEATLLTRAQLAEAITGSSAALKARLMDQSRVAGLGNLLCDEVLWRAGLDPTRSSASLTTADLIALHRAVRTTLRVLTARGGSHLGDLGSHREPHGRCPRDGNALVRGTVGGRTTYWCPVHQR